MDMVASSLEGDVVLRRYSRGFPASGQESVPATCARLWESGRLAFSACPGKTFNTAGLRSSAIAARGELGERLEEAKRLMGLHN